MLQEHILYTSFGDVSSVVVVQLYVGEKYIEKNNISIISIIIIIIIFIIMLEKSATIKKYF